MCSDLILASNSTSRAKLLRNACVRFKAVNAQVDEEMIKLTLATECTTPRDTADTLAEFKARKVSASHPGALVLGCDQVLDFQGKVFSKPRSCNDARSQLWDLRGNRHQLFSAAVIYRDGQPLWRFIGAARLTMHNFTDAYLNEYLMRNWDGVKHCVGAYKLEGEGVRLFEKVEGDYFTILGMPLVEILSYLTRQGELQR